MAGSFLQHLPTKLASRSIHIELERVEDKEEGGAFRLHSRVLLIVKLDAYEAIELLSLVDDVSEVGENYVVLFAASTQFLPIWVESTCIYMETERLRRLGDTVGWLGD